MANYILEGVTIVIHKPSGTSFPVDTPGNRYWDEYVRWMADGNTADPYVGPTALENWIEDMARSDTALLSRAMEDMLDGMPDKSGVAQITLDRLQAKKDLRATKP